MKIKVLQTEESKRVHNEHDDDSPNGIHGTAVAARALGTKFGVAKKVSDSTHSKEISKTEGVNWSWIVRELITQFLTRLL